MARVQALATTELAQEAARTALQDGATALGAVLTGFFVEAGQSPGVLFGPVSLLVGGLGSGVFAYDGRHRQPGLEAKRPRGFEQGEEIPPAARVAAPGSVHAAALACAFHPGTTILSCVRPGVSQAKQAGKKGRAELLELVATKAATALTDPRVRRAFTSLFGTVEGGLITPADLAAREDVQAKALTFDDSYRTPWGQTEEGSAGAGHAIVAGDSKGLFAALSYGELTSGLELAPFETTVPMTAEPVRRGVTRVPPGTPIARADSLWLPRSTNGTVSGASVELGGRVLAVLRVDDGKELMARDTRS
jgi:hypothetical protein